ncbi:hypothetical protein GGTG_10539 [Gaeumannomyces tritici R3-111a-1]|uniref:Uncharacterized protein n=1 Tax=Gaeumannomyces tritici (strain R3-111a-1) TaxID=644352 RepID=J3PAL4_GAET3|nr:hypothetical protein GGTG_10539 [Gaeumannomyces tritici R3-111a-1]EJT71280.1 hypothetical protein GGTG_10539 [Gaeumannomyces tritici R3-111a-1]
MAISSLSLVARALPFFPILGIIVDVVVYLGRGCVVPVGRRPASPETLVRVALLEVHCVEYAVPRQPHPQRAQFVRQDFVYPGFHNGPAFVLRQEEIQYPVSECLILCIGPWHQFQQFLQPDCVRLVCLVSVFFKDIVLWMRITYADIAVGSLMRKRGQVGGLSWRRGEPTLRCRADVGSRLVSRIGIVSTGNRAGGVSLSDARSSSSSSPFSVERFVLSGGFGSEEASRTAAGFGIAGFPDLGRDSAVVFSGGTLALYSLTSSPASFFIYFLNHLFLNFLFFIFNFLNFLFLFF